MWITTLHGHEAPTPWVRLLRPRRRARAGTPVRGSRRPRTRSPLGRGRAAGTPRLDRSS